MERPSVAGGDWRQRFSCQARRCPISGAGVFWRTRGLRDNVPVPRENAPKWSAAIAQLVEHVIRNDGVTGSKSCLRHQPSSNLQAFKSRSA